jgi:hypothetical protein
VLIGLGLFVVLAAVGGAVYSPTLKRQIAVVENEGSKSAVYQALQRRATIVGMFLGVVAIAVVFVMVFKPQV